MSPRSSGETKRSLPPCSRRWRRYTGRTGTFRGGQRTSRRRTVVLLVHIKREVRFVSAGAFAEGCRQPVDPRSDALPFLKSPPLCGGGGGHGRGSLTFQSLEGLSLPAFERRRRDGPDAQHRSSRQDDRRGGDDDPLLRSDRGVADAESRGVGLSTLRSAWRGAA